MAEGIFTFKLERTVFTKSVLAFEKHKITIRELSHFFLEVILCNFANKRPDRIFAICSDLGFCHYCNCAVCNSNRTIAFIEHPMLFIHYLDWNYATKIIEKGCCCSVRIVTICLAREWGQFGASHFCQLMWFSEFVWSCKYLTIFCYTFFSQTFHRLFTDLFIQLEKWKSWRQLMDRWGPRDDCGLLPAIQQQLSRGQKEPPLVTAASNCLLRGVPRSIKCNQCEYASENTQWRKFK